MKEKNYNTQIKKNTINLAIYTALWTVSLAIATFGPIFFWEENKTITFIGVLVNAVFGVLMILANVKHMNGLDELQKKIQLDAMGIALGVGVVGGLSYSLLDTTNLITQDAEISFLIILIALTYMAGIIIGQKRYK
jgi:drug/metabolite transporter (DMT)-like permease